MHDETKLVGGPASLEVAQLQLAGGGDFSKMPQQTTMPEIHVEVIQPPPDNTLFIVTGIVVPVILAIFGWWVTHRRKAPAGAEKGDPVHSPRFPHEILLDC